MKYGTSFPIMSSRGVTGVETSCSMVPRSHSLAIVSEVRKEPMTAMMMAMTPGTILAVLSRFSLNQVLISTPTEDETVLSPWR